MSANNPYDGHTLTKTMEATESVTGVEVSDVYVDKSYRGHGCDRPTDARAYRRIELEADLT